MAGMSFFLARSPVTPKMTRAQGSGMRGSRRSCGSRSGLLMTPPALVGLVIRPPASVRWSCQAFRRGEQLGDAGGPVGEVQVQQWPFALRQRLPVTRRLRRLQGAE